MARSERKQGPWGCLRPLGIFLIVTGGLCGILTHNSRFEYGLNPFLIAVVIGVQIYVKWAWWARPVDPESSGKPDTSHAERPTTTARPALGRRSISPPSYDVTMDDEGYGTGRAEGYYEGYQEGFDEGMTYGYAFGSEEHDDHTPEGAEWRDSDDDPTAR